jgi:Tfp pilus assembly protein PilO
MSASGMSLTRRLITEHRRIVLPLGVALLVNVLVYALVVYPLSQRVANVEQRNQAAEAALRAARAEYAQANGTLTGKDRAATELATFYKDVLPPDLSGARRLTQLRLQQLARQSGLTFQRAGYNPVPERNSSLTRLNISMVLSGSYPDIRMFIYQLETAPEFVVIDNVSLSEGADAGQLTVTLQLSTYYRNK